MILTYKTNPIVSYLGVFTSDRIDMHWQRWVVVVAVSCVAPSPCNMQCFLSNQAVCSKINLIKLVDNCSISLGLHCSFNSSFAMVSLHVFGISMLLLLELASEFANL